MANFRPLQPAPMEQEPPPAQPKVASLLTQKPKRTVTLGACIACRRRKSKCDGSRPVCTCCAQKDTECIFELGPNEKPSQAMKRKNDEMQGELANLRQLFDFLRLCPEQDALEVLRRIRHSSSDNTPTQRIHELAEFVRHGDLLAQTLFSLPAHHRPKCANSLTLPPLRLALHSPSSDPSAYPHSLPYPNILTMAPDGPSSQRRRHTSDVDVSAQSVVASAPPRTLLTNPSSDSQSSTSSRTSIEAILQEPQSPMGTTDPRLASVRNWITGSHDNHLLINIMCNWHKWEYSYHHFLEWDFFLDDLASGQTNFCSKLLVNAVLASGSFQSSMAHNRSTSHSDDVAGFFYKEARRLWELDEGQDNLPRLQAALCLFMVLAKHGRDKVGHIFLVEACRIAHDIGLFRVLPMTCPRNPQGVSEEKWERARAVTAWAFFNFQLSLSFTYSCPLLVKSQPPLRIPYEEELEEALFRYECGRSVIVMDCANTFVDPDGVHSEIPPKPERIEVLYLRLKEWWDSRPDHLDPVKFPSPENLLAAMQYNVSITHLFQPFLDPGSSLERVRTYHSRARSLFSISLVRLRELLVLHQVHHGWSNTLPFILHPIMVTGFGSLDEICLVKRSRFMPEKSEPYKGLLTCFHALIALSNWMFYAQPLFRLLTQTCETLDIGLPLEVTSLIQNYRTTEWTKNAASMVSSRYVADVRTTTTETESRMDFVVSQWDDALTLGKDGSASWNEMVKGKYQGA